MEKIKLIKCEKCRKKKPISEFIMGHPFCIDCEVVTKFKKTSRALKVESTRNKISELEELAEKKAIEVGKGKAKLNEYMSLLASITTAKHHLEFLLQGRKSIGLEDRYLSTRP